MTSDSRKSESITPAQVRAARALLNLEQATLARKAGVSRQTLISIEAETRGSLDPRRQASMQLIKTALEEDWGIEFLGKKGQDEGVRRRWKR